MSTAILSTSPVRIAERCDGCGKLSDEVGNDDSVTAERRALARRWTYVADDRERSVRAFCEPCAEAAPFLRGDFGTGVALWDYLLGLRGGWLAPRYLTACFWHRYFQRRWLR